MTNHIYKRGNIFYYKRRVPKHVEPYENRKFVKLSLSTKDEKEAIRKAAIYNDYIEDYWRSLIKAEGPDKAQAEYQVAISQAKAHGYAYKSIVEIASAPLNEIIERVKTASTHIDSPETVKSILGGAEKASPKLSECPEKFWTLAADRVVNKSDNQIRKWKNPRKLAIDNLIEAIGDISLAEITRSDILRYRQWWVDRIDRKTVSASTANKHFILVRDLLQTVAMAYEINIDFDVLFSKIRLKAIGKSRPPFEPSYVQDTLLRYSKLKGLNLEARMLIFAMADTGSRESELIGLKGEDIILDSDIPYIWIRASAGHSLKTQSSERKIPLVGASLYAFQHLPDGFSHYTNADTASSTINKYLRENDLKPTKAHSLYSLRHTFKDRLRDAHAPEEVIDELMGHVKSGPKYGRGHLLETKHDFLKKIEYKIRDHHLPQ